jgi:N-terminal domain of anti-restriction factor ArdC
MTIDSEVLEGLHRDLRDKLTEFTAGDEWLAWLHGARQFHRYSPTNQLLLMLQGAQGHVASYRTWQRIPAVDGGHCQVRRGEHGLTILAPLTTTRREIDDETGEEMVVAAGIKGFRPVKVFHQGQLVAPPALTEQPMPTVLEGPDRWQHVWTAVIDELAERGYTVQLHTAAPGETWKGRTHFGDGHIEVMDDLAPPQRLKTLMHEWAHIALGHGGVDRPARRDLQEVEAESVAYLLCQTIQLDSSSYTIPYLARWSFGDPELAETTAQRILTTTAAMVTALESSLSVELTPDLFTLTNRDPAPPTALPGRGSEQPASRQLSVVRKATLLVDQPPDPTVDDAPVSLRGLLGRLDRGDRPVLLNAVTRLEDPDALATAVALCADGGLDAGHTAAALRALGADPVALRRTMKRAVADVDGHRQFLFADVDDAFRNGAAPSCLDPVDAAVLYRVDVDDSDQLQGAVRLLHRAGTYRPGEIREVLSHLGVAAAEIDTAMAAAGLTAVSPRASGGPAPVEAALETLRYRVSEHETLLRRVVDDGRDPHRAAALAAGLGISHTETITACANIGLEPALTARIALARRDGQTTLAASDLAAGWTADPPAEGWAPLLSTGADTAQDNLGPATSGETAARAVLAQWRKADTPPPTPAMT